jgi:hypothetical protein
MSGGHFNYRQNDIYEIAIEIERLIEINDRAAGYSFSPTVIDIFKEAAFTLRAAGMFAQRIDYLVSGDDSEETFFTRLNQEASNLKIPE